MVLYEIFVFQFYGNGDSQQLAHGIQHMMWWGERRYIYVYRFMHTGCPKSRLTEIVKCLTAITFAFVRWLYFHQLERSSLHYLLFVPAVMSLVRLLVVTFCWWL